MKEPINIRIKTTQDNESTVWESEGVLFKEEDIYVVSYPDYTSNTITDNRLEISPDRMRLIRNGTFTSNMLFEENILTSGSYDVMFYKTDIEVLTKDYQFSETNDTLTLFANYQLFDAGQEIADNEIEITVNKI